MTLILIPSCSQVLFPCFLPVSSFSPIQLFVQAAARAEDAGENPVKNMSLGKNVFWAHHHHHRCRVRVVDTGCCFACSDSVSVAAVVVYMRCCFLLCIYSDNVGVVAVIGELALHATKLILLQLLSMRLIMLLPQCIEDALINLVVGGGLVLHAVMISLITLLAMHALMLLLLLADLIMLLLNASNDVVVVFFFIVVVLVLNALLLPLLF